MEHFGKWLRVLVEGSGRSKKKFASDIGVEAVTLRSWFNSPRPSLRPENLVNLAKALGTHKEVLEERLRAAVVEPDQNIEVGSMRTLDEIPTFDRDLAAGGWTEAITVNEDEISFAQIKQGLFRVRLSGDSMTPDYKNGNVVEFRVINVCMEGLAEGADFYIQRDDELATFKRVEKLSEEMVTLRALNKKKYPEPMMVETSRIVRCAIAVAIVTLINQ